MIAKTAKRIRRHRRIRKQIVGKTHMPRLAVFRSNKHIYAQIIDDEKGTTVAQASDLDKDFAKAVKEVKGKKASVAKAYAVGKLIAERAKAKKINKAVFDRGGFLYFGRVRALADGARDGGLTI